MAGEAQEVGFGRTPETEEDMLSTGRPASRKEGDDPAFITYAQHDRPDSWPVRRGSQDRAHARGLYKALSLVGTRSLRR